MNWTGVIIAFNEEAFIETSIRHAMKFCDRIIVVEGAVLKSRSLSPDGRSTDGTVDILTQLKEEFKDRLTLIFGNGYWESKSDMFKATSHLMEDDWVIQIDCDEFYHLDAIERLKGFLSSHKGYTQVNFYLNHFFGGFGSMVVREAGAWGNQPTHGIPRVFRSFKGAKWLSHTPPKLEFKGPEKILTRDQTEQLGVICFHYGYVFLYQAIAKAEFHAPWQKWSIVAEWHLVRLSVDLRKEFKSGNRYTLFTGDHPIDVTKIMEPKTKDVETDDYIVFIGTGRCGTTYAARCMTANGFDVQHEKIGKDGIASWDLAFPKSTNQPWTGSLQVPNDSYYIHLVRNPVDCIASLMTIGDKSWEFICKMTRNSMQYTPILRAMMHYIMWNNQCSVISKRTVRIEHFEEDTNRHGCRKTLTPLNGGPVNQRDHKKLTVDDLRKVSPELTKIIMQMANAYGYE